MPTARELDHQTMTPAEFKWCYEGTAYKEILDVEYQDGYEFHFNPIMISYNEVPARSGAYCLIFPNGMKYIGQASNLRRRIFAHLMHILYTFKENNGIAYWYYEAKESLNLTGTTPEQYQQLLSLIKIQLCFTHCQTRVENYFLTNILKNKEYAHYYNGDYIDPETGKRIRVRKKGQIMI